ncbi:hypothetical protein ACX93W_20635 [Paenibacillus sp. CAU 1782]
MIDQDRDLTILAALRNQAAEIEPPGELKNKIFKELELWSDGGGFLGKVTVAMLKPDDPFDQLVGGLPPGSGIAIYSLADNPDRTVSNQTNYGLVRWSGGLEALLKEMQPYAIKRPQNEVIKEIYAMYGFGSLAESEIAAMRKEAEKSGKTVVRPLPPSGKMVGFKLVCEDDGARWEQHVLTTTKNRVHVPDISSHEVELTRVGGHKAVYLGDAFNRQLLWIEEADGQRLQYEIRTGDFDKGQVMELALGITKKNTGDD